MGQNIVFYKLCLAKHLDSHAVKVEKKVGYKFFFNFELNENVAKSYPIQNPMLKKFGSKKTVGRRVVLNYTEA